MGLNCTVRVAVWPGFRVNGKFAPETVKPAPVTEAALTVTAAVPVDERVIAWLEGELTDTVPNARLAGLTERVGTELPS